MHSRAPPRRGELPGPTSPAPHPPPCSSTGLLGGGRGRKLQQVGQVELGAAVGGDIHLPFTGRGAEVVREAGGLMQDLDTPWETQERAQQEGHAPPGHAGNQPKQDKGAHRKTRKPQSQARSWPELPELGQHRGSPSSPAGTGVTAEVEDIPWGAGSIRGDTSNVPVGSAAQLLGLGQVKEL